MDGLIRFQRITILVMSSVATMAVVSGCAGVLTPVPASNYNELESHRTYYVVTKSGDTRQTAQQAIDDSVLVIEKPRAALHDSREYPVRIPFEDIESISTIKTESLVYIESGVEAGNRSGADRYSDSPFLLTSELGHITGERVGRVHPRWGYGGTLYFGANSDEFIGGVKARVRYRAGDGYSFDAAAGPLFGKHHGFVGSVGFNFGGVFTLKSEWVQFNVEPWSESDGYEVTQHPGGTTYGWYNGIMFRGPAGAAAISIQVLYAVAMAVALGAALSSTN